MIKINLFFLLILSFSTFAQQQDSIKEVKKWEFDFQFDQKNSIITGSRLLGKNVSTLINGISIGMEYKEKYRIGFGGYITKSQSPKAFMITDKVYVEKIHSLIPSLNQINKGYLVSSNLSLYYFTTNFEYQFFDSKWLELSIPIEIGYGYSSMSINDFFASTSVPILNKKKDRVLNGSNNFVPASIGLNTILNLSPDVMFAASFGYRKIVKEIGISQNFDGLYYQFGLQLIPGRIIKEFKADFKKWKARKR